MTIGASSLAVAAPVEFKQVVQVVNAKPGKAATGSFSSLRLADDSSGATTAAGGNTNGDGGGDGGDDTPKPAKQDDRVITETKIEIVEDEVCDCVDPIVITKGGFPKWALLGLAAVPAGLLFTGGDDDDDGSGGNPTPTPNATPTITPPTTPTPPEPVPEPMTILLFGTGLAGIGIAARKRLGKKEKTKNDAA